MSWCSPISASMVPTVCRNAPRPGRPNPIHSITSEQLARLVAQTGEELVGLCYFGDQQSRERIEAQLAAVPPLFFIGSDARPRALPAAIAFAAQSGSGFTE